MCDARGEHAIFAEARVDYPGVIGNTVAPVICVVVVTLLAATMFLVGRGVAHCEWFAVRREFVVGTGVVLRGV